MSTTRDALVEEAGAAVVHRGAGGTVATAHAIPRQLRWSRAAIEARGHRIEMLATVPEASQSPGTIDIETLHSPHLVSRIGS